MSALHCWAEGPWTHDEMTTTCILKSGHAGEHEYTRDDRIGISFAGPDTPISNLHETEKDLAEIIKEEA